MSDLATTQDLTARESGDPQAAVDAAEAEFRAACRWHIAPSRTDTVTVQSSSWTLFLPTLYLTDVSEVVDPDGNVVDPDLYSWREAGLVIPDGLRRWRNGSWTVTFTHGYAAVPQDVRDAVVELAARIKDDPLGNVAAKVRGPFSETYRDDENARLRRVVQRYRVPHMVPR